MKKHIKQLLFGDTVYLPKYDMSGTAIRRDNVTKAEPSKIIISEGLFTLTEKVVDAFDFKIYVDVSHDVQKTRFYERAQARGLGDSADEVFSNKWADEIYFPRKVTKKSQINEEKIVYIFQLSRRTWTNRSACCCPWSIYRTTILKNVCTIIK